MTKRWATYATSRTVVDLRGPPGFVTGTRVVRNVDGHVVVTGKVRRTAYHAAYLLAHAGQVLRRERETVPVAFASYPENAVPRYLAVVGDDGQGFERFADAKRWAERMAIYHHVLRRAVLVKVGTPLVWVGEPYYAAAGGRDVRWSRLAT